MPSVRAIRPYLVLILTFVAMILPEVARADTYDEIKFVPSPGIKDLEATIVSQEITRDGLLRAEKDCILQVRGGASILSATVPDYEVFTASVAAWQQANLLTSPNKAIAAEARSDVRKLVHSIGANERSATRLSRKIQQAAQKLRGPLRLVVIGTGSVLVWDVVAGEPDAARIHMAARKMKERLYCQAILTELIGPRFEEIMNEGGDGSP